MSCHHVNPRQISRQSGRVERRAGGTFHTRPCDRGLTAGCNCVPQARYITTCERALGFAAAPFGIEPWCVSAPRMLLRLITPPFPCHYCWSNNLTSGVGEGRSPQAMTRRAIGTIPRLPVGGQGGWRLHFGWLRLRLRLRLLHESGGHHQRSPRVWFRTGVASHMQHLLSHRQVMRMRHRMRQWLRWLPLCGHQNG